MLTLSDRPAILSDVTTTISRRDQRKRENREALIQASANLFRAHGYEATTVDQIAAAARVSRRTFFRYFANKDAVVFPHADARLALFRAHLVAKPGETRFDAVRRACRAVGEEFARNREELVFQQQLIDSSVVLAARERALDRDWEGALADALLQGRRRTAAAARQARIAAGVVMGGMRAALREWYASGGTLEPEALTEQALAVVAGALEAS